MEKLIFYDLVKQISHFLALYLFLINDFILILTCYDILIALSLNRFSKLSIYGTMNNETQ